MTSLSLQNVTKRYTTDQAAVDRISLDVQPGELLALLGPSGCGKTTTLRMIAGLIRPDSGDILYDGHSMLAVPPQKRGAVMVFQQDTLFPFRSVGDNVAFGLRFQKQKPTSNEIKTQVANALKAVQLAGYESRYPAQLSGGQRQRVALARALVLRPRLLLLDEPLSHLDEELRVELREMIRLIQQERQLTTIFVTHDQTEAVSIADRIAVMLDGRLQQTEMPQTFFRSPKTPEIARFFGWENIFTGIAKDGLLETDLGMLKCDVAIQTQRSNRYEWCIRPEAINIISADHAERQSSPNCFTGRVIAYRFFGDYAQVQAEFNGLTLFIKTEPFHIFRPGDQVVAQLPGQHIHIFV